jgi:hypothetical protein
MENKTIKGTLSSLGEKGLKPKEMKTEEIKK